MAWFVSRRNCPSFLTANTVAGPLDGAHRSGPTGGDHQDPPAAFLRPPRTAHPLGPPPHPASSPRLALGKPIQQRRGETARPAAPFLTVAPATGPPTRHPAHGTSPPTRTNSAREGHFLPTVCRITPAMATAGHQNRVGVATSHRPHPHLLASDLPRSPSLAHHPWFQPQRPSLRWIRGKEHPGPLPGRFRSGLVLSAGRPVPADRRRGVGGCIQLVQA